MDLKDLVHVDWRDQRVLTTAQIAERFGCPVDNIQRNFNRNRDQFIEGEDYFKLTGEELRDLRTICPEVVAPRTPVLYLWTEWGVLLHVKMINSDEAWAMYKNLVKFYFRYRDVVIAQPAATVDKSAARSAAQLKPAHVYVALLQNVDGEFVKIGISSEPLKRIRVVKKQTDSITCDFNITSLMPREVSRFIEGLCKEKFSSRRIEGEFFSVNFAEMFDAVKMFTKTALGKTIDEEDFEKLKNQVKLLTEPAEDFAEIIYRGDLLAGENIFCMAIK